MFVNCAEFVRPLGLVNFCSTFLVYDMRMLLLRDLQLPLLSLGFFADKLLFLFLLQYQNVFAPLIKLEADYDKVCIHP